MNSTRFRNVISFKVFLGYLVLERVLAHGMCTMLTVFHYSMSAWAAEYIAGKGKKGPSKSNA
jgi:hypothetical protein